MVICPPPPNTTFKYLHTRLFVLLQPEVAPLPAISDIQESVAPQSMLMTLFILFLTETFQNSVPETPPPPSWQVGRHGSLWHYYQSLHRCHPRNVCHACCYCTDNWYNPFEKGLFWKICLFMMWAPCLPCLVIGWCICILFCVGDDD